MKNDKKYCSKCKVVLTNTEERKSHQKNCNGSIYCCYCRVAFNCSEFYTSHIASCAKLYQSFEDSNNTPSFNFSSKIETARMMNKQNGES